MISRNDYDPLTQRQILVLLTGMLLPSIPPEHRFLETGVYRSLVGRGLLQPDKRGGYKITPEGVAAIKAVPPAAISHAVTTDILAVFPRPQAAE